MARGAAAHRLAVLVSLAHAVGHLAEGPLAGHRVFEMNGGDVNFEFRNGRYAMLHVNSGNLALEVRADVLTGIEVGALGRLRGEPHPVGVGTVSRVARLA